MRIGTIPAVIAPYIVARTGVGLAKRLFCTGETFSAADAMDHQIVSEVVEDIKAGHSLVKQICEDVVKCSPHAVTASKRLVDGVAGQQLTHNLMFYTCSALFQSMNSPDAKDGIKAALGGTPAPWEGKPLIPLY